MAINFRWENFGGHRSLLQKPFPRGEDRMIG